MRAVAAILLTLAATTPTGYAQQAGTASAPPDKAASDLPVAPVPVSTQPIPLRTSDRDYSKAFGIWHGNPINIYRPTTIAKASFANSVRLADLVKDGKIYLSLSDAIALALENNYDIAIARYDLDIADTDVLRTRTGALPLGAPSGLITGTLGGSTSILSTGGGPGGSAGGSGGAGSGVSGLTLSTQGAGPVPESLDPTITGTVQLERARSQQTSIFSPASSTNTDSYDFAYNQGFVPGTALSVGWNNSRTNTSNTLASYTPQVNSSFKAVVTQQLLQGAGIWVNKRFIYQALNDRRITDSSFRQQILYTVNQVETIYWGLVQAYQDVQAKQHALEQSNQLLSDNRKQLQVGSMAPLDVVNAESSVAADQQSLISAQSALNYQQQVIKQAITRNLNDATLAAAPVIPTDRVSLEPISEEGQPVEALVQEAFQRRPELEQAVLTLRNDEITLKGARNALLPTLDVYGFYSASIIGGAVNKNCSFAGISCTVTGNTAPGGYGGVLSDLVNSTAPDKGIGFNVTIPIRNREAQSKQERSLMEYRQAELRLEQLYTQIRMQVANAMFALTNDRAQVRSAQAANDYAQQSLDAEQKKLHLGASTTANVLQQQRNMAVAQDNLIAANAAYAKDRAGLYQTLASTLQHYGINLPDAAAGTVTTAPVIPGVAPAQPGNEPTMTPPAAPTQQTMPPAQ
ncbi:MAG: TolC family protein [Terracidiphilus sp.]|nr:TolC family protein [Terracidiphilus sp.]MDR3798645.1 TolC family protein [Terracidiphilus sp.]